jgi:hypothetical protein
MLIIGMYIYPEDMCGKVARASERPSVEASCTSVQSIANLKALA